MTEVVEIKHVLRRMRGGSQAFLVEGADGECYVAKFQRNPQGTRTLINEWITWRILERLDISTPEMRLLRLSESTRGASDDLYFSLAHRQIEIEPGLHLGSRCPVDLRNTAIFDFLPQKLLTRLLNHTDFLKVFVLDCALGQADSRQAIFARDRKRGGFRAYLIDHGMMFGGREWVIRDLPRVAVYFDVAAYPRPTWPIFLRTRFDGWKTASARKICILQLRSFRPTGSVRKTVARSRTYSNRYSAGGGICKRYCPGTGKSFGFL